MKNKSKNWICDSQTPLPLLQVLFRLNFAQPVYKILLDPAKDLQD